MCRPTLSGMGVVRQFEHTKLKPTKIYSVGFLNRYTKICTNENFPAIRYLILYKSLASSQGSSQLFFVTHKTRKSLYYSQNSPNYLLAYYHSLDFIQTAEVTSKFHSNFRNKLSIFICQFHVLDHTAVDKIVS